jgi:hypothetical protein
MVGRRRPLGPERGTRSAVARVTLHERLDGEWSYLETLRHLLFVTDVWIAGNVLGRQDHFHPFGVPPSFVPDPARFGIDVAAEPAFDEVVVA